MFGEMFADHRLTLYCGCAFDRDQPDLPACSCRSPGEAARAGRVEPRPEVRGDIARTHLYMSETYGITLDPGQRRLLEAWDRVDPPDDFERTPTPGFSSSRATATGSSSGPITRPAWLRAYARGRARWRADLDHLQGPPPRKGGSRRRRHEPPTTPGSLGDGRGRSDRSVEARPRSARAGRHPA